MKKVVLWQRSWQSQIWEVVKILWYLSNGCILRCANNLDCFAALAMTEDLHLSLRDLCQQYVMAERVVLWQRSWQSRIWEVEKKLRYLSKDWLLRCVYSLDCFACNDRRPSPVIARPLPIGCEGWGGDALAKVAAISNLGNWGNIAVSIHWLN